MEILESSLQKKHGIFQIIIALLWLLSECNLWYSYHVVGGLYTFKTPDFVIFISIFIALLAIIVGCKTFQGKIKIGYLLIGLGWFGTLILEILS